MSYNNVNDYNKIDKCALSKYRNGNNKKNKKITIIPTLKIKIKNKTLPSKIWYKSTHLLYKNHEFRIRPFP